MLGVCQEGTSSIDFLLLPIVKRQAPSPRLVTPPILLGGSGVPLRVGTATEAKPLTGQATPAEPKTELGPACPAVPPFSTGSGAGSPIPVDTVANIVDGATVRRPVASSARQGATIATTKAHEGPREAGIRLLQIAAGSSRIPRSDVARRLRPEPTYTTSVAAAASVTDVAAAFATSP